MQSMCVSKPKTLYGGGEGKRKGWKGWREIERQRYTLPGDLVWNFIQRSQVEHV